MNATRCKEEIVTDVLKFRSNLSSYGIARLCELSEEDVRPVILDLLENEIITSTCRLLDRDGKYRMVYNLK